MSPRCGTRVYWPSFKKPPRLVRRYTPTGNGDLALDIGCGSGAISLWLSKKKGFRCIALDRILPEDPPRHPGLEFRQGDVREFDFRPDCYRLIIALHVLQLLKGSERSEILVRAFRALQVGGRLILASFTMDDPEYLDMLRERPEQVRDGGYWCSEHGVHKNFLERRELVRWCERRPARVLHYKELIVVDDHPPTGKHEHAVAQLVCEKTGVD